MSLYFGIPILLLGAVLQSIWLEDVRILGGRPDLVMLLVITWAIIRGLDEGVLWGFVGGLFCDLLSGGPFGVWSVALTLVAFLVGQPWVHSLGPTSIRLAMMAGLGTLAAHHLLLGMLILLGYPVDWGWSLQTIIGPAALLNFLLSPLSFMALVWFHQRGQRRGGLSL
ncbi:MAG TPA: rod shape-determining protein MreD [Chloroflexi bacterium]|nr:rod shape-determining protein MreD [Chloroflexota bacterium]